VQGIFACHKSIHLIQQRETNKSLFSDINGNLTRFLRRQPGAMTISHSSTGKEKF